MALLATRKRVLRFAICLPLAGALLAGHGAAFAATALKDIKGHWAESSIQILLSKGIVTGFQDNTFRPEQTVKRPEFYTMLNKAMGFTQTVTPYFSDVSSRDWFYPEVSRALAAGYISGEFQNGGKLNPDTAVSRQEAASMLAKAAGLSMSETALSFSDSSQISSWRKSAVAAVVKAGIMSGYPDRTFKPMKPVTRAQIASMLVQVMNKYGGTSNPGVGTIVSYKPLNPIVVNQGTNPSTMLPTFVDASYSDGSIRKVPVSWPSISTDMVGTYKIKGTLTGSVFKPDLIVHVVSPTTGGGSTGNNGNTGTGGNNGGIIGGDNNTAGPGLGDVKISYSSLFSTIIVKTGDKVTSVTANGDVMHYEGSNTFSLATAGLKLGQKVTVKAHDISGKVIDQKELIVQSTTTGS